MDRDHLSTLLRELHTELDQGGAVDTDTRQLLLTVLADIEGTLDRPAPPPREEHHTLAERLKNATWQLEETHPRLTNTVAQLIDVLGRTIQ